MAVSTYTEAQAPAATSTPPAIPPMVGYCTTTVSSGTADKYEVLWTVYSFPSAGAVFTWSGAASSTGNVDNVTTTFNTSGRRTAVVNVRSGAQAMTLACGADFAVPDVSTTTSSQYQHIGGKCQPSTAGLTVHWSAYSIGARGTTTYQWIGDGFATTTTNTAGIPLEVTYPTEGVKSAQVLIQADGQALTLFCQAKVASSTNSGGCFIATAAFGTEMEPEVVTLRKFRDDKLLTNKLGKIFVDGYYKASPPVADYIRNKPLLKLGVRTALRPVIWTAAKLD